MDAATFKARYERDRYIAHPPQQYKEHAPEIAKLIQTMLERKMIILRTIYPWGFWYVLIVENVNSELPCTSVHVKEQLFRVDPLLSWGSRYDCTVEVEQLRPNLPEHAKIIEQAKRDYGVPLRGGVVLSLNGYAVKNTIRKIKGAIQFDFKGYVRTLEKKFPEDRYAEWARPLNMIKAALDGACNTAGNILDAGMADMGDDIPDDPYRPRQLIQ